MKVKNQVRCNATDVGHAQMNQTANQDSSKKKLKFFKL